MTLTFDLNRDLLQCLINSPGESNPFPKRMFQIHAMNQQIGAIKQKSVVFQTRFEITLALDH